MDFTEFVRRPFTIEAVQITEENLKEVAKYCGSVRRMPNGQRYIRINPQKVPNLLNVFPGYWMTKMGNNIRCYTNKIFVEQFVENTPEIKTWVSFMNGDEDSEKVEASG